MRRIRLLMIAIASFFGTIIGEGLVRRAIALLMCGVLSFNSTACYSFFSNQANASIPANTAKSITQVEKNADFPNSQTEVNGVIAQIPRVRQQNQPASDNKPLSDNNETVKPSAIPSQSQPTITPKTQLNQIDANSQTSATTTSFSNKISLNRWWATAGEGEIPIILTVSVPETGVYWLTVDDKDLGRGWSVKAGTPVKVLNTKFTNRIGEAAGLTEKLTSLKLSAGVNNIEISGLAVPSQPAIDGIIFKLNKPNTQAVIAGLDALFVADRRISFPRTQLEELAKKYAPILHFDTESSSKNPDKDIRFERYQIPFNAKQTTWQTAEKAFKNHQMSRGDADSFINLDYWKSVTAVNQNSPNSAIYASFVQRGRELAINYYFHYPYSNWKEHGGWNNHQGDWEGVTLFLKQDAGGSFTPLSMAFAQHVQIAGFKGGKKIAWKNLRLNSNRPHVYVGLGGHASYPFPGCTKYPTGVEYHAGGVTFDNPSRIIYLPSAGTAIGNREWNIEEEWAWLLYSGIWGNTRAEGSPPRGPIFLDTNIFNISKSTGRGERWLDPWAWSEDFGLTSEDDVEQCKSSNDKPKDRSGKLIAGAKSYGDPHIVTFDGYRYSFQTVGEFILAKSSDRVFEVQTRQSPVNRSLSLNSAVAMRVGNTRVAFYSKDFPDSDTSTPLRVNGKPMVMRDKSLSLPGGGSIQKQNDSNYVVQWATGENVAVTIYSRGQFQYMDVFPFVFESQANQMVGLLGNVNGKENDDLRFRSGDILPSKSTYGNLNQLIQGVLPIRLPLGQLEKIYFDQLNKDFGNSWRVSSQESLFDYPAGKSTKAFTDKAFPDAYLTLDMLSPNQLQTARSQCLNAGVQAGLLEGCVFDVGFTGYSEFAARTAQVSNILNIVESVIPGFKNPIPEIIRKLPKIPGLPF